MTNKIFWNSKILYSLGVKSEFYQFGFFYEYLLYKEVIYIDIENLRVNTDYCYDSNGSSEFGCECNEGFSGRRCENKCPLECQNNEICTLEIKKGIKQWKCKCETGYVKVANVCEETCVLNPCKELINNYVNR